MATRTPTAPKLVTPDIVTEVSRTARPHTVLGWSLTVEDLIILYAQRSADWIGSFMQLTPSAAKRIAGEINEAQPWKVGEPQEEILDGELVPPSSPISVGKRARAALTG